MPRSAAPPVSARAKEPGSGATLEPGFETRMLLLARRGHEIGPLLNANFDLRTTIYNIAEGNRSMVMTARRAGASAKFAGSGGAIIGTYEDETMFRALEKALNGIGCVVFKPEIA